MDYKQINTFEKVLEFKGETLDQFNERTKGMDIDTIGYEKVKAIVFALNGGKHIKRGFYPCFYNPNSSSSSFSLFGCCGDVDGGGISANHLLIDQQIAKYAGRTFPLEYSQFINATNN